MYIKTVTVVSQPGRYSSHVLLHAGDRCWSDAVGKMETMSLNSVENLCVGVTLVQTVHSILYGRRTSSRPTGTCQWCVPINQSFLNPPHLFLNLLKPTTQLSGPVFRCHAFLSCTQRTQSIQRNFLLVLPQMCVASTQRTSQTRSRLPLHSSLPGSPHSWQLVMFLLLTSVLNTEARGANWSFRPSIMRCHAPAETLSLWVFLTLGIKLPPLSSGSSPPAPSPAPNFPPSPVCQGHVSMAVSWLVYYPLWS